VSSSSLLRNARRTTISTIGAIAAVIALSIGASTPAQAVAAGEYEKYPWSDQVYVTTSQWAAKAINYAEWSAAGYPTPRVGLVTGSSVIAFLTNPHEIFVSPWSEDGFPHVDDHHVTYSEWQAVGSPTPQRFNIGFIKTASSPDIYQCNGSGTAAAYKLTYESWKSRGFPTPVIVSTITGRCP
jgi:hypothetical protein